MNVSIRVVVALLFSLASSPGSAAPGDIYAEVMAAPPGLYSPDFPWFSAGHAFLCIAYHLNSGIKEECYGFYPKPAKDAAFVGAPDLADEFKQNPDRFSQISWSLKKKISTSQRQAFFNLVAKANMADYVLLKNNCGDFVHDAVDAFGWSNVPKGALPEPYVRDLVVANIARFATGNGNTNTTLTRTGDTWVHKIPIENRTYKFKKSDDTFIYLYDSSHKLELRIPIRGGSYQYSYNGQGWGEFGTATPEFD